MWALLSRRAWLWILITLGVPLLRWLLGIIETRLTTRGGPTRLVRALGHLRIWLDRRDTAPHPTPTRPKPPGPDINPRT